MTAYETIPEIDVLIATTIWLHSQNWIVESVSVATGKGINAYACKQKLETSLVQAGVPIDKIRFTSDGPDIIARKDAMLWKIECKGVGVYEPSTLRNNFDRALASTVSYYDQKEGLRIGLAVPLYEYFKLVISKIHPALRQAINLWLLLYRQDTKSIKSIEPNISLA